MNNINKWLEGRTYRQRLMEAEERTAWTWRDVFEGVAGIILVCFIMYLMFVIVPLITAKP